MKTLRQGSEADGFVIFDSADTRVLSANQERELLQMLAECKRQLSDLLARVPGRDGQAGPQNPRSLERAIAAFVADTEPVEPRLGSLMRRYRELRGQLALANVRLVAHVAKPFRNHGLAYADLLQEGFCGLLEAIDRFDLNHQTKLGTYATWWIRQAMQQAVAAGAYAVRLNPRHLRQLARNQELLQQGEESAPPVEPTAASDGSPSPELIQRIHTATRPTISLDAPADEGAGVSLIHALSDHKADHTDDVALDETISKLFQSLRPREQEVVALRFGLVGRPRKSLSQVGKLLKVSKERVRQIQKNALEKLRVAAEENDGADLFLGGSSRSDRGQLVPR